MKVLILTKRQTTNKDILDEKFGRPREFPLALAKLGHTVRGACLSYKNKTEGVFFDSDEQTEHKVIWHSFNAGLIKPLGLIRYIIESLNVLREFNSDLIISYSDTFYSIIGQWFSKKFGVKHVLDLQDNYEAYSSSKIPGVLYLFRKAIREADGIVANTEVIYEKTINDYRRINKPGIVLNNSVNTSLFYPQNKKECRSKLSLPENKCIIGLFGALHRRRDIDIIMKWLLDALHMNDNLHLACAGSSDIEIPKTFQIQYVGDLDYTQMPVFINALDIAVIYNTNSKFARYVFPQKTYEIIACKRPFISSNIDSMQRLLKDNPEFLFDMNSQEDFKYKLNQLIENPRIAPIALTTWTEQAKKLDQFLLQI